MTLGRVLSAGKWLSGGSLFLPRRLFRIGAHACQVSYLGWDISEIYEGFVSSSRFYGAFLFRFLWQCERMQRVPDEILPPFLPKEALLYSWRGESEGKNNSVVLLFSLRYDGHLHPRRKAGKRDLPHPFRTIFQTTLSKEKVLYCQSYRKCLVAKFAQYQTVWTSNWSAPFGRILARVDLYERNEESGKMSGRVAR